MSCFLPDGTKRPILDVESEYLIYLWNFPNFLPMVELKRDVFRRYGFIRFIETFEAWTNKKIGQVILEFVDQNEFDAFVNAFERKEVLNTFDPPIEFVCLQKLGKKEFFKFVKQRSKVDLLACRGIPLSFNKNKNSSFRPQSVNKGKYKDIDEQSQYNNDKKQTNNNIFSRITREKDDENNNNGDGNFGNRKNSFNGKENTNNNNDSTSSNFFRGGNNYRGGSHSSGSGGRGSGSVGSSSSNFRGNSGGGGGGFGSGSSKRGGGRGGLKGRIPKPYASEWENSRASPRLTKQEKQQIENQNKYNNTIGENIENNFYSRPFSSVSPFGNSRDSVTPNQDEFNNDNNNKNYMEDNGGEEEKNKEDLETTEENKLDEPKKDAENKFNENKIDDNENDEELIKIEEETNKNNFINFNSSKASTLSICSSTSNTSLATTIRRLSPPLSFLKNNNNINEATTNNSTTSSSHFNNYRNKPPSLASEDDECRSVMLIRNIKLGFSIERILEDLQNFGDIVYHKQLDETSAIFKFLDASEAELASKVVSKNSNLFGNTAIFELQR